MLLKFSLTLLFIFIYISTSTPLACKNRILELHTAKCSAVRQPLSLTPNDQHFKRQKNLQIANAARLWEGVFMQQKPIRVAVIDSGIAPGHYDLKNRVLAGYNVLDKSSNVQDGTGHGTKVSGIIAAEHNNSLGISGVAGPFDVKILPIKVIDEGMQTTLAENIAAAVNYAILQGVDVINISYGGLQYSSTEHNAIKNAVANGIVVVAPSGNDYSHNTYYPAAYDEVISVGSHEEDFSISSFTSVNPGLDILAPGFAIRTTEPPDGISNPNSTFGSSFAAAFVSGICSIIKAICPSLSPSQIKEILKSTAITNSTRHLCVDSLSAIKSAANISYPAEIELEYDNMRLSAGYEKFSIKAIVSGNPDHVIWHKNSDYVYACSGEEFSFSGATLKESGFVRGKLPFLENSDQCSYTYFPSNLVTSLDNGLWRVDVENGFLLENFDPNHTSYTIISHFADEIPQIRPRIGRDITFGEKYPKQVGDTYKITVMDSQGNPRTYFFEIKPPQNTVSTTATVQNNTADFILNYYFKENVPTILHMICAVYEPNQDTLIKLKYVSVFPAEGTGTYKESLEVPPNAKVKAIILKDIENLVPY